MTWVDVLVAFLMASAAGTLTAMFMMLAKVMTEDRHDDNGPWY